MIGTTSGGTLIDKTTKNERNVISTMPMNAQKFGT